jgi:flagellar motility protein MotE (MotC chaperone)
MPDVKTGDAAPANPEAQEVPAAGSGSAEDPMLMSQSEIDLLQRLSQRRNELESWSSDLSMREQLLKAAEMRIDNKVAELKKIQEEVKSSLKQHDAEQEEKLKSLVKIYETMKPKDAARIFEQLEMPILLDVIERMKERKAAPVIADMNPEKAKKLTIEMVKRRRLAGEETQRTAEQVSRTQ